MKNYSKRRILCMGLTILLTQLLYWVVFFKFHTIVYIPSKVFHQIPSYEQWTWMTSQVPVPYENIVEITTTILGFLLFINMSYFILDLMFGKDSPLRGALNVKLAVAGISILLYVILFIYNYKAPVYYLYMSLSLVFVESLMLACFLFVIWIRYNSKLR